MQENPTTNSYYLNRENAWRDFQAVGLELRSDGAWQLAAVPRLVEPAPPDLERLPEPDAPAGLAVDPWGTLYYSLPQAHRLGSIGPCAGGKPAPARLPGVTVRGARERALPGRLRAPRGLLYHAERRALFVADSGNSRIQILDPLTWQVLETWGRAGAPGAAPWGLHAPWSLAADPQGSVYVVDVAENGQAETVHTVIKFDLRGRPDLSFQETAQRTADLDRPVGVAVAVSGDTVSILVLDAGQGAVVVLDTAGRCLARFGQGILARPLALAAAGSAVYVGDNTHRAVLVFAGTRGGPPFTLAGRAQEYSGPVAALALGTESDLWLLPGVGMQPGTRSAAKNGSLGPLRLDAAGAYARSGVLWGGPFGTGVRSVRWHRLRAALSGLGEGVHAQFFVYGTHDADETPPAPAAETNALVVGEPGPFAGWRPLPLDVDDGLVPPPEMTAAPGGPIPISPFESAELSRQRKALGKEPYLWVGAHLSGEGTGTPILEQMWLNYDHPTYRQHLPGIFGLDPEQADLLDRLLALFESFFHEAEEGIRDLDRLVDPQGTPTTWLNWLAGWLALDLDERWPEAQQRAAIQRALAVSACRGTPAGLRQALRDWAGVDAHIEEPIRRSSWWALAGSGEAELPQQQASILGVTTRLAPAQPEGAVLGGSATLDNSFLIGAEAYGAPLFENIAHRFTVQVYRGQIRRRGMMDRVRAVIEREKPAHTMYHLCVIEPRMRVGFQARVGIDTVVAGPVQPSALDDAAAAAGLVLGGEPAGRIGIESQVGTSTRLTTKA